MRINGIRYKILNSPKIYNKDIIKVHLGPGQRNYISGWINVDANMFTAKCDVWTDIERSLPFKDSSVDVIYSHHVAEHLFDLESHFAEVFRVLKPGGVYRLGVPNGDAAIAKFIEEDFQWFGDYPKKFDGIGGKLNNFILCNNEHVHIMTESYLAEFIKFAGFKKFSRGLPTRIIENHLFEDVLINERERDFDYPHTLMLEITK